MHKCFGSADEQLIRVADNTTRATQCHMATKLNSKKLDGDFRRTKLFSWLRWACAAVTLTIMTVALMYTNCSITLSTGPVVRPNRSNGVTNLPFPVSCTTSVFSKQTCMFQDVCLQLRSASEGTTNLTLTAVLRSSTKASHAELLLKHLEALLQDTDIVELEVEANSTSQMDTTDFEVVHQPSLLWSPDGANPYSFGHSLVNEAYPMFMALQNHFGPNIPLDFQLVMTVAPWHEVLRNVYVNMITKNYHILTEMLQPDHSGMCFRQLLTGDGGYVVAGRQSVMLKGDGMISQQYKELGTWFNSNNWWNFRTRVLQLHGLHDQVLSPSARPLVILNDKRHGPEAERDRRMIMNIDAVVDELSALYPNADVKAIRFRDLDMVDQIKWLSQATLFITTQASSSFGLIFLPRGATCLMIGNPLNSTDTAWVSFHELDVWFPLTYIHFMRYEIKIEDTNDYNMHVVPGHWEPSDPEEKNNWWLFNADVRLDMGRLVSMVDPVLQAREGARQGL